jgi:hypothetical protein
MRVYLGECLLVLTILVNDPNVVSPMFLHTSIRFPSAISALYRNADANYCATLTTAGFNLTRPTVF